METPSSIDIAIGNRLFKIREAQNNIDQLAFYEKYLEKELPNNNRKTSQAKRNYVSYLELGKRRPSIELLRIYSRIGNVSIDSIINGEDFKISKNIGITSPNYAVSNMGELFSHLYSLIDTLPYLELSIDEDGTDIDTYTKKISINFDYSMKEFIDYIKDINNPNENILISKSVMYALIHKIKSIKDINDNSIYNDLKSKYISDASTFDINNPDKNTKDMPKSLISSIKTYLSWYQLQYSIDKFDDKSFDLIKSTMDEIARA